MDCVEGWVSESACKKMSLRMTELLRATAEVNCSSLSGLLATVAESLRARNTTPHLHLNLLPMNDFLTA